MEVALAFIQYLQNNHMSAAGLVLALAGVYYLLNQKPRIAREADELLERLREERGHYYDDVRPPR